MSIAITRRPAGSGGPLDFLAALRRRKLWLWFLAPGCLAATAVNEAVRWSTVWLNRWLGLDLPVLDVGPPFLLVAVLATARRWPPLRTAALADALLRFEDRLASLVDFAGRADIAPAVRAAHRAEVGRALGGRTAASVLPLRPALLAGPLLLLVSLGYPLLLPSSRIGFVQMARRIVAPPGGRGSRSDGSLEGLGNAPRPAPGARGPQAPAPSASRTAPPQSPPPAADRSGQRAEDGADRPLPTPGAARMRMRSPDGELVSNQVGERLTKVVNPLFQQGAAPPAPPEEQAGGTIAFRLLPKTGKTGEGEGTGAGENPEAATLDLDAVPETYRQIVRTYFTLLGGGGASRPGAGGTPTDQPRKD